MIEPEIKNALTDLERRVANLELKFEEGKKPSVKRTAVREFLLSTKVDDDLKKTLVLGYFLEKIDGLPSFSVSDLQKAFMLAKERVPSNLNDMVNKNISKGFMMETEEKREKKKTWCLTNSGDQHVENNLLKPEVSQ
jgi:hypothetical protein